MSKHDETFEAILGPPPGRPPPVEFVDDEVVLDDGALHAYDSLLVATGSVPNRFLKRLARHAVVPVADTTLSRPLVGRFFRLLVPHPVPITREADHTWQRVVEGLNEIAASR